MDINKRNWFNTTVSTADLVNVLDLTIEQKRILATMFHFGDVQCQTAGGPNLFIVRGVPNPQEALTLVDITRAQVRIDQKHA